MKLSIVIVNYNVKYFLHQCLISVFNAIKTIDAEIWVVDNNSVDGSVQMIEENFPAVKVISNTKNVGFSRANNQAIKQSSGEYILLLNPDTIIEEDTFTKTVDFMDNHPTAGGLGVHMIDGKGNFLPESKRGIPTPETAFYKMSGLIKLFPRSKKIAKYYMGHLDKNENNKIQILSGAFMMLRKSVLDEIGLLDENFFMYGEDIDLSYRILQAGYDNYYFSDTKIVHYKGESTKKGSLNYVFVFYNAMIIFFKKHFAKKNTQYFVFLIKTAIFFRAAIAIIKRIVKKSYLFVADTLFIYLGFYLFIPIWEKFQFNNANMYPNYIWYIILIYILIWIVSAYYSGAYDNPLKFKNIFIGISIGTIIILIFYALINVKFRFSRALIIIGAIYSTVIMTTIRIILYFLRKYTNYSIFSKKQQRVILVGNITETQRVKSFLYQINLNVDVVGFVTDNFDKKKLGNLSQISEIVRIYKINEVIFCAKDISTQKIIGQMLTLSSSNVSVKIAPKDSFSVIGSNSINTAGDLYIQNLNTINSRNNQRLKKLVDRFTALIFVICYPLLVFFVKNRVRFLKNILLVGIGKYSWVGFYTFGDEKNTVLPAIKKGVLTPLEIIKDSEKLSNDVKNKFNLSYAKNYKISTDLFIIFKGLRNLGQKIR